MAKKKKKISSTSIKNPAKHIFDFSNWENMSGGDFHRYKVNARHFYYEHSTTKDLEGHFRRFLKKYTNYKKKEIELILSAYMLPGVGISCKLLETGCPDYNEKENEYWKTLDGTTGEIRPISSYIYENIEIMLKKGKNVKKEKEEKPVTNVISIQERMSEQIGPLLENFEGFIDDWLDGDMPFKPFDPYKQMLSYTTAIKPAHAKLILSHFSRMIDESKEVLEFKDSEIREAYSHLSTSKQRKEFHGIYEKIENACNMIIQSGKANRKPRKPKQISNEKLVSKMNYQERSTEYSLVSVNPASIIGAQELWVFNTKTKKIGKYVADEYEGPLSVKGSTLQGFDKIKSITKKLRKPEEQLKEFQSAGKVALRKYLDNLTTKDSPLTGRINKDTILLKVT